MGQMWTESVVLAAAGGALGMVLAYGAWLAFRQYAPATLPRMDHVLMDGRVFVFTLVAVAVTGLLFGVLPAWRMSRIDPHLALKEKSKGSAGKTLFRQALLVGQVASALVLLTCAWLLIRSLFELAAVDLGFAPERVVSMRVTPLPAKYAGQVEQQIQFGRNVVERLRQTPGVEVAALSTDLPLQGNPRFIMRIEGKPPVTVATAPLADYFTVTPGYFEAMRVPLRRGRALRDTDQQGAPLAVVVNEEFVKTHFPNEDPIGKRLEIGFSEPPNWRVIVGVAGNVRNLGVDKPSRVQVYGAYWQGPGIIPGQAPSFSVIARTQGEPAAMAQTVRRAILDVDNAQPVWNVKTLEETVDASLGKERFTLFVMAVFAGVAFVLALIGLAGVMTYTVSQRQREIGIRMAVGARPLDVLWMVEQQALVLVGVGLVVGTGLSLGLAQTMGSLLYGTRPYDPVVFGGVAALFAVTALVSGWVPARRAARIDPAIALRAD